MFRYDPVHPAFNSTVKIRNPKSFPRIYRKRLTMHEIERVTEESTSGRENAGAPIAATNKLSHRLSTSQLLTFLTSSLIPLHGSTIQRFNGSTIQRFNA